MSVEELDSLIINFRMMLTNIHNTYFREHIYTAISHLRELYQESRLTIETSSEEQQPIIHTVFDDDTSTEPQLIYTSPVSDDEICGILRMLNSYQELIVLKSNVSTILSLLIKKQKEKRLSEFAENKEFYSDLEKTMSHDKKKHHYLYHGTQGVEEAESILEQGLGMMQEELSSTTYSELSIEELLLYNIGFDRRIGKDAVVIIDMPLNEDGKPEKIVRPKAKEQKITFVPSGLQGLNGQARFIIDPKFIVGFVDKRNKRIVLNPRYCDYERIKGNDEKSKLKEIEEAVKQNSKPIDQ